MNFIFSFFILIPHNRYKHRFNFCYHHFPVYARWLYFPGNKDYRQSESFLDASCSVPICCFLFLLSPSLPCCESFYFSSCIVHYVITLEDLFFVSLNCFFIYKSCLQKWQNQMKNSSPVHTDWCPASFSKPLSFLQLVFLHPNFKHTDHVHF